MTAPCPFRYYVDKDGDMYDDAEALVVSAGRDGSPEEARVEERQVPYAGGVLSSLHNLCVRPPCRARL